MATFEAFGTPWRNLRVAGSEFRIDHLAPFDLQVPLEGQSVATIKIAFGHHVFTDDKAVGPAFRFSGEERYLSPDRIGRSVGLPGLLQQRFADEHSRACRNKTGGKQFFMLQEGDWAIFHDLRLVDAKLSRFTMRVISAYTVDEINRLSLPTRSQLYTNRVILSRLLSGQTLNHDGKRR